MRARCPTIVAFVSDAVYPFSIGGRELRYHELSRRLGSRAELHIYTMNWWGGPRIHREGPVTFHAIARLTPLYSNHRRSITQALLFAFGCLRLLWCRFDVLEADQIPFFHVLVLRIVTAVRRKRFVVTWHEVWGRASWNHYLGRAGFAAWLVEWLAMRVPDHIIAASPETAGRLRTIVGERASISVAPNGIDLDAISNTYPDTTVTDLVVVGRLMGHKRVDLLLQAMALLHAEEIPVTCRVIGDGPDRDQLAAATETLGLGHAVEFRHDVREQKDVYSLVKAARVAVFPSAREGFGIAVLEAIACGTPVVTTSAPDNLAQSLVARSARGIVCDHSAAALASAIKGLLGSCGPDPGQGAGADKAWLAEYSWDGIANLAAEALRL